MSVPKNVLNRLVKLPKELIIDDFIPHVRHDEIVVEIPRPETVPCPYCNSEHCNIKDNGRKRSVHHLAFGSRGTMITFKQRRYICKDCEHSFQEPVYWVMDNIRITGALYLEICRDLQTTASIIDIAKRNAVSESIVRHVLEATPAYVPPHLPKTLCIDEFSGSAGHWDPEQSRWIVSDYHCNLADGDHGTVYDILPSPNKAYLFEYFYALPPEERAHVEFFCCDMRSGFLTFAKTVFPHAKICIDTFHVVKLFSDNVTDLRCSLQRWYRDGGDKDSYLLLKNSARILTTAKSNQPDYWKGERAIKNQKKLEECLTLSDELKESYDMLQEMYAIVRTASYSSQFAMLEDLLSDHRNSPYESVRHCVNTVCHNKGYILNAFRYSKTNAVCEGVNNKIKILKKNGYGAHKFDNFRNRILFACGPVKFVRESYTTFAEKLSGKEAK